jgi:hypothetical protein
MPWRVTFACLIATLTSTAQSRTPTLIPDIESDLRAQPAPHDWRAKPSTFNLITVDPRARSGKVWIRKSAEGLVVAGQVDGPPPDFPPSAAGLMTKDHVEIWLAVTPNPEFDTMVWDYRQGSIALPEGEKSCPDAAAEGDIPEEERERWVENCQKWVRWQRSYRAQLTRLFARQWQLAPQAGAETFAQPALRTLANLSQNPSDQQLAPWPKALDAPRLLATPDSSPAGGYRFETVIPWRMFPPSGVATIQDVQILVEVFSPAPAGAKNGPYSTTAPGRRYGNFASFNLARFTTPRRYRLTLCDEPLSGYFYPSDSEMIASTFFFQHVVGSLESAALSDIRIDMHHYSKEVAPGKLLCGPRLYYFDSVRRTKLIVPGTDPGIGQIEVGEEDLGLRRDSNGRLLIRHGPREAEYNEGNGLGRCAACPVGALDIYSMDSTGSLETLLTIMTDRVDPVPGGLEDLDIQVSRDWSRVVVYLKTDDKWSSQAYCRKAGPYEKCGTPGHAAPPEPRTMRFDQ